MIDIDWKCKGCGLVVRVGKYTLRDYMKGNTNIQHLEFIYKTGYCQLCLVEMGYCD